MTEKISARLRAGWSLKTRRGFLLPAVILLLMLLLVIVPAMVKWVQDDTKISVKDQASSTAFNLAESAVDRGYWKVKSSTSTYALVAAGEGLPGYRFDAVYGDLPGGTYRVYVASGPSTDQVTIIGEGRNARGTETRSIKAVYTNTSILGAIIAGGMLSATGSSVVHWGPIMAMNDITVSGSALNTHYPRKLSKQTVKPLDPTGNTNPPNTDNLEWWSDYDVPELPQFDFSTMRASAAATGTLNCDDVTIASVTYTAVTNPCTGTGCHDPGWNCTCYSGMVGLACNSGSHCSCTVRAVGSACVGGGSCSCSGSGADRVCSGSGCTDSDGAATGCTLTKVCTGWGCSDSDGAGTGCAASTLCIGSGCEDTGANCDCVAGVASSTQNISGMHCCSSEYFGGPVTCSYGGSGCVNCSVNNLFDYASMRDKDYTWYWDNNVNWAGRNGLRGTIVVRGNLGISGGDNYCPNCVLPVPAAAWKEYQKIDTSAIKQYPADTGYHQNSSTYVLGSCGNTCEGGATGSDLGVYGFLYVGGDFNRTGDSDIYGAMWVDGSVSGSGNATVFYNSSLKLPTLNVVLLKDSWQEETPNPSPW